MTLKPPGNINLDIYVRSFFFFYSVKLVLPLAAAWMCVCPVQTYLKNNSFEISRKEGGHTHTHIYTHTHTHS